MKKYVSLSKLSTFLDKLKTIFAPLSHTHNLNDLTDYSVDSALSDTSTNPVQNKVIDAEFDSVATAMNALESSIDENLATAKAYTDSSIATLTSGTPIQIGGTEPTSGPILWFDTTSA